MQGQGTLLVEGGHSFSGEWNEGVCDEHESKLNELKADFDEKAKQKEQEFITLAQENEERKDSELKAINVAEWIKYLWTKDIEYRWAHITNPPQLNSVDNVAWSRALLHCCKEF